MKLTDMLNEEYNREKIDGTIADTDENCKNAEDFRNVVPKTIVETIKDLLIYSSEESNGWESITTSIRPIDKKTTKMKIAVDLEKLFDEIDDYTISMDITEFVYNNYLVKRLDWLRNIADLLKTEFEKGEILPLTEFEISYVHCEENTVGDDMCPVGITFHLEIKRIN